MPLSSNQQFKTQIFTSLITENKKATNPFIQKVKTEFGCFCKSVLKLAAIYFSADQLIDGLSLVFPVFCSRKSADTFIEPGTCVQNRLTCFWSVLRFNCKDYNKKKNFPGRKDCVIFCKVCVSFRLISCSAKHILLESNTVQIYCITYYDLTDQTSVLLLGVFFGFKMKNVLLVSF